MWGEERSSYAPSRRGFREVLTIYNCLNTSVKKKNSRGLIGNFSVQGSFHGMMGLIRLKLATFGFSVRMSFRIRRLCIEGGDISEASVAFGIASDYPV